MCDGNCFDAVAKLRLCDESVLEDDMTKLNTAIRECATLETAPTRYVEGNGIRFAYRQLGPSSGTPLVLLQHFSGNIDAWDPAVVNALAADRR